MTTMTAQIDLAAVKSKQNAAWGSGDYSRIGSRLQIVGEQLAEALDLPAGAKVLDVAAGNGNVTLALARRWCDVTSTDYVDTLLARGRARAAADDLEATFKHADAENLPFADASFDAVVSTFGVMFTPDQRKAASELVRVCRPGGRIGMANWTPQGFIGEVFKTLGRHLPPPAGVSSPALWGSRPWLDETFAGKVRTIESTPRDYVFRHPSPVHFMEYFRTYYGPIHKAYLALETGRQSALTTDLTALIDRFNTARDGTMRVPSAYLEVVMTKA